MRNKIAILMVILMIVLVSVLALPVNATNATVNLNSETQVNPGDTFIVTLNAAYEEGINGIEGTLSYDKDKLELSNVEIVNTLNWSVINETVADGLDLAIICNSTSKITDAEIIKIHFKVKDEASIGTTAKIELKDITIDGDTANSTQELGTIEIQVSIVEETTNPNPGENPGGNNPGQTPGEDDPWGNPEGKTLTGIEVTKEPTKNTYKVGEKFDKTGMVVVAKYSDGTSKEITNYTIENGDKLEKGQKSVKINYTEENVTKTVEQKITVEEEKVFEEIKQDDSKSENKMPDTGVSSVIGLMAVVVIFGAVCLVKYNKYKEI